MWPAITAMRDMTLHNNRLCKIFLIVAALCLALFNVCKAAEKPTEKGIIRIGVEDVNYYPLYAFDRAGETYTGYARELLDAFASKYHYTFEYHGLPIKRLFKKYFRNEVDVKFPDSPKWKKSQKEKYRIHYTLSVIQFKEVMFVNFTNKNIKLVDFNNLGIVRGFTPWKFLSLINSGQMKVTESSKPESLLKMVSTGRVQGAMLDENVGRYLIKKMGGGLPLTVNPNLMDISEGNFYLSSIHYPELVDQFNEFMTMESELIRELQEKYGIEKYSL